MTHSTTPPATGSRTASAARVLLNKVPEVTIWFWVIKILCTTVGESFADWIDMQLGVGLIGTSVIFTGVLAGVLVVQMRLTRYVPAAYWLTVVVVSVTGTLYTDILTDRMGVPLWISTSVFSVLLAGVFAVWWARERTLSIHSITTTPREGFYWLAVLTTFALGTATGDWTLELTGWGPGTSVLLPLSLIVLVAALWRYGANPVLAFWVAYILTRPLGANIGDWLAGPRSEQGLGLGTFGTSLVFLVAILATVVLLTITRADVVEQDRAEANDHDTDAPEAPTAPASADPARRGRERVSLAVMALAAVATVSLLAWADHQPHVSGLGAEEGAPACSSASVDATQARADVAAHFPADRVAAYRTITQDTLALVDAGDAAGAAARITDLETAWDADQDTLQPTDCATWTYVDQQIDPALAAVRAGSPSAAQEDEALHALLDTLGS
ncbi:MAG: hypothetical protein CMH83_14790 [Nocardioides sp.]|nr:hypothetical protein [Nocardioides sp.]